MTGYELSERMRKTRKLYPLTATEQALYNELVAICNDVEWKDIFPCSNAQLCAALDINEKTLARARNTLIQQGLIHYASGKSRRNFGNYSFTKKLTTVKNTVDVSTDTTTNVTTIVGGDVSTNVSDYHKGKGKQKLKYRDNVFLLPEENKKLIDSHGEDFVNACYDYLHDYKIEKGYKSQSDYLTIKRWVTKAVREQQEKEGRLVSMQPTLKKVSNYDPHDPKNKW